MTRGMLWLVVWSLRLASTLLFMGLVYAWLFGMDVDELIKWKVRAWAYGTGLWSFWINGIRDRVAE